MLSQNTVLVLVAVVPAVLLINLLTVFVPGWILWYRLRHIPIVNKRPGEWTDTKAKKRVLDDAKAVIEEGLTRFQGRPFQIVSNFSRAVFVPPHMIDAIKTDSRLSSSEVLKRALSVDVPGFEGLQELTKPGVPNPFIQMVRTKLTQNLSKFTDILADESQKAFSSAWGMSEEWHEISIMKTIQDVVSKLSARIFLGEELARNKDWLDITIEYTVNLFQAQRQLRDYPEWSRNYVHWFLPDCIKLRNQVARAKSIMAPIVAERLKAIKLAEQGMGKMPNDAIAWIHETARGKDYNPVHTQLAVSVAALHTTSDLLTTILIDLAANPQYVEPARAEIREALGENGWQKTSLYRMKLVDSIMKESQRIKPTAMAAMGRMCMDDVTLPDGTFIPKGAQISTPGNRMWDPEYYPQPEQWQGDRYMKLREQPGKENSSQFVTTGPESLGFGHGLHACPGRFFASNEVKIALIEILSNYDFELPTKDVPKPRVLGMELLANADAKLRIRRRPQGLAA